MVRSCCTLIFPHPRVQGPSGLSSPELYLLSTNFHQPYERLRYLQPSQLLLNRIPYVLIVFFINQSTWVISTRSMTWSSSAPVRSPLLRGGGGEEEEEGGERGLQSNHQIANASVINRSDRVHSLWVTTSLRTELLPDCNLLTPCSQCLRLRGKEGAQHRRQQLLWRVRLLQLSIVHRSVANA